MPEQDQQDNSRQIDDLEEKTTEQDDPSGNSGDSDGGQSEGSGTGLTSDSFGADGDDGDELGGGQGDFRQTH